MNSGAAVLGRQHTTSDVEAGYRCMFITDQTLRAHPAIEQEIAAIPNRNVVFQDEDKDLCETGVIIPLSVLEEDFPELLQKLALIPNENVQTPCNSPSPSPPQPTPHLTYVFFPSS